LSSSDSWDKYIDNLLPVLKKLTEAYEEKVDVNYFNKIMNFELGHIGSGSTTLVSGWILNFFGLEG